MSDLIAALTILLKYDDDRFPTHCEHDVLRVMIDPALVSVDDKDALKAYGFEPDGNEPCFYSFRFGSN